MVVVLSVVVMGGVVVDTIGVEVVVGAIVGATVGAIVVGATVGLLVRKDTVPNSKLMTVMNTNTARGECKHWIESQNSKQNHNQKVSYYCKQRGMWYIIQESIRI